MKSLCYISGIGLLLVLVFILYRKKNYYPYAARHLLTKREYRFYLLLREVADEYHCIICPKVGVKDLLAVTDTKQYMKYFHNPGNRQKADLQAVSLKLFFVPFFMDGISIHFLHSNLPDLFYSYP